MDSIDTQKRQGEEEFSFKSNKKKKQKNNNNRRNRGRVLNNNKFDLHSSFERCMNNLKSSVEKKKNEFELSVENENDKMRKIAETNDVLNQAERMENYQPMMGKEVNNLFENGYSELKKEVDGLKKIINNSNMGGYYSVDENEIINNPGLGKYVFVDTQPENFKDLVENSSNDKLRELFKKAKKKLSEKKKKEEKKEESSEDSSLNELGLLEDKNNKNDFNMINNSEPDTGKKNINNMLAYDSD